MVSASRPLRAWTALLVVSACSAGPASEQQAAPSPVRVVQVAASCSPGARCEGAAPSPRPEVQAAPCLNGAPGLRCDGLLGADALRDLSPALDAMQKAVKDAGFSDVHATVRLACLQLRRDLDVADGDGASDAARGLKNAMRAVAVLETSAEARLALALGLARALQGSRASADPTLRERALDLVELALRAVPPAQGAVGAATRTLEGYLALERGQKVWASAAFDAATALHGKLGTAWTGLGDLARSGSDFGAARAAYERAAALLPGDAGVARALAAAVRREVLVLPVASAARPKAITPWPLAPAAPAVPSCPAPAAAAPRGAALCKGLAGLAGASSPAEREQAAMLIVNGWPEVRPLCEVNDRACGPYVVEALGAAARAFESAGRTAKAIGVAKIVLDHPTLPGAAAAAPGLALEVGDRYFALGIFEIAADWYARHARLAGMYLVGPAADRALAIYAAFANADGATKLADDLAKNDLYAAAQRASWIVSAAAVVRAVRGAGEAVTWLERYRALLGEAGAASRAEDASRPLPEAAPSITCAAPLSCAVKRLVGENW